MDFKLAIKVNGKWQNVGSFKKNKWDNYQVSFRMTPELGKLLLETATGGWVNIPAFADDGERKPKPAQSKEETEVTLNDKIPFALILPAIGISSLVLNHVMEIMGYAQGIIG